MSIRRLVSDFALAGFVRSSSPPVTYDTDGVVFDPYAGIRGTAIEMKFLSRRPVGLPSWEISDSMPWFACAIALFGADFVPTQPSPEAHRQTVSSVRGTRWQAESQNFVVTNRHPAQDARKVAELCEGCRTRLQDAWCDSTCPTCECRSCGCKSWSPRCQIVVYANQSTYQAAVGVGAAQTFGSSLIRFGTSKQVSHRQIDFRGDSQHGAAALPHEMTHVVLADLLGGCQPPRWADEGMAILADPQNKQQLHQRDVQAAQASRLAFRAVELLTIDQYPHPSRVPAFYGQSASLTAFLVERDDPATFVSFLRDAVSLGYDAALREHYDIDNVAALEKLWHKDRTTRLGKVSLASHNEANTSRRGIDTVGSNIVRPRRILPRGFTSLSSEQGWPP